MRISDWSSDVCSSNLVRFDRRRVVIAFHGLVDARFVGAEQAVEAVAGLVRADGGRELGADAFEGFGLVGLHAQRCDDADRAHGQTPFPGSGRPRPAGPIRFLSRPPTGPATPSTEARSAGKGCILTCRSPRALVDSNKKKQHS